MATAIRSTGNVSRDIELLRVSASKYLTNLDFVNICSVGVFGSFAQGTASEKSAVGVVIVHALRDSHRPSGSFLLKLVREVLAQVWGREINIANINYDQNEFLKYGRPEILLSSRTIHFCDDLARAQIAHLRYVLKQHVEEIGSALEVILEGIQGLRRSVEHVGSFEDFLKQQPDHCENTVLELCRILEDLDDGRQDDLTHARFWRDLEPVEEMIMHLQCAGDEGPMKVLLTTWIFLSTPSDGFGLLAERIEKSVLPVLANMKKIGHQAEDVYAV